MELRELPTPPSNKKIGKMKKVEVVRIVISGALRAVSDKFEIHTGKLNVTIRVRTAL